ncbi:hypothetical protein [Thermaerobacter litoralis]
MAKEAVLVKMDPVLARRLRIRAAQEGITMSALVERALRKELDGMDLHDAFAQHLGYATWNDLLTASEQVAAEGDVGWYITRLPDGRWAAWDDAETAADRVSLHATRDDAVRYQWSGWENSLDGRPETDRVRWLAGVPQGVPSLADLFARAAKAGCSLLDAAGTPLTAEHVDELGGTTLPVRIAWYDEPEPLVSEGDPPRLHPRWQGTPCNWRSARVAWEESRAQVWGEVVAGTAWFAVVGEADPRALWRS